jgi:peptide methionine sulfoxide reductase msrA/msrB
MTGLRAIVAILVTSSLLGCGLQQDDNAGVSPAVEPKKDLSGASVATFAGGCFWCVEADFEKVPGVLEAVSGYSGGKEPDPTYSQVSSGRTQHLEVVQVHYDPSVISYEGLLQAFWRMIDPTDAGGQFSDRGRQYATAIFVHDDDQRSTAERSLDALEATGRHAAPLVTPIRPAVTFYMAEDYHQDYYRRNSVRYSFYRYNSGRDRYLEDVWGDDLEVDFSRYLPPPSQPASKPKAVQASESTD